MAIDTRIKRQSAILEMASPIAPDGFIDQYDRAALLGQYAGNVAVSVDLAFVNFYAERAKSLSLFTDRAIALNHYAERTRTISMER